MKKQYCNIKIDTDRDQNFTELSTKTFKDYYCLTEEPSPQFALAKNIKCLLLWRQTTCTKNL